MAFVKGTSGNPNGRPKVPNEVLALARAAAPDAIRKLVELIKSPEDKIALQASNAVLDRAYGKPIQATELMGAEGGALQVIVNVQTKEVQND